MTKRTSDFKIGDTVKVLHGGTNVGGNFGIHQGSITTVSDVSDFFVYINGKDKHSGLGLTPYHLEVVVADGLDFTKPLQTRDGRKVTIVTTEGRGEYPVIAYIGDETRPSTFTKDGAFYVGETTDDDLVIAAKAVYVNVWRDHTGELNIGSGRYKTSDDAKKAASTFTLLKHVGVKKIVEGTFDA